MPASLGTGFIDGSKLIAAIPIAGNVANGDSPYYSAYEYEFDATASVAWFKMLTNYEAAAGFYKFQLYVDGNPIENAGISMPAIPNGTSMQAVLTFSTSKKRRIRISFGKTFTLRRIGVLLAGDTITSVTKSGTAAYVLGDSWVEGYALNPRVLFLSAQARARDRLGNLPGRTNRHRTHRIPATNTTPTTPASTPLPHPVHPPSS